MLCVIPFCPKDAHLAWDLIRWIQDLGHVESHHCLLVADRATDAELCLRILYVARNTFSSADLITNDAPVSGWIAGANDLFRTAAKWAEERNLPWLWLEPDAIPLKASWLDDIAAAEERSSALFLGHMYSCDQPGLPKRLMSGVAVYPAWLNDSLKLFDNRAFDVVLADRMVKEGEHTELIHHLWGKKDVPPTFAKRGVPNTHVFDLAAIPKQSVIWHRNKDGSLLRLLRESQHRPDMAPCYIQLGRFGDIMIVLRALRVWHERTGQRPKLIVAQNYASVVDGVSYIEPVPLSVQWWMGIPEARKHAVQMFGGEQVLQCHGKDWGVNIAQWPNYQTSMWDRTGIQVSLMQMTPLVFDKRNLAFESVFAAKYLSPVKPNLLYSFEGISSPFKHSTEIRGELLKMRNEFNLVNIGAITAPHIYDMLGLMDRGALLVTIDSALLHLAAGSNIPVIAYTVDGWTSSVPFKNCICEIKYANAMKEIGRLRDALHSVQPKVAA